MNEGFGTLRGSNYWQIFWGVNYTFKWKKKTLITHSSKILMSFERASKIVLWEHATIVKKSQLKEQTWL